MGLDGEGAAAGAGGTAGLRCCGNRLGAVERRKWGRGPRVYDWTALDIRPLREPGRGHWLLVRRGIAKPEKLAYYVGLGSAVTNLEELVRVAGVRWSIEECFEEAKGLVDLDKYEVRKWDGWYRHITLAMLAHAYLAVVKHRTMEPGCSLERGAIPAWTKG